MISKCANPDCFAHFLYLHEGKLFRVLHQASDGSGSQAGDDHFMSKKCVARVEFFWLCPECATRMTIKYEKGTGIVVRPKAIALRAAS
jgi:hypothetical protein